MSIPSVRVFVCNFIYAGFYPCLLYTSFKDVCPTAMIFVPSEGGVSHRKEEFTSREDCARGGKVLLGLLLETAGVSDKID